MLFVGLFPCENVEQFKVGKSQFCQTVVLLDLVHLGQRTAVVFQIQLAVEQRELVLACFDVFHELRHRRRDDLGHTVEILCALQKFEHTVGRSAAAVAKSVRRESVVVGLLVADLGNGTHQRRNIGD